MPGMWDVQCQGQDDGVAPARLLSRDKEAMRPQGCKGHLSPPGSSGTDSSHGQRPAEGGSVRAFQLLHIPVSSPAQAVLRCPCPAPFPAGCRHPPGCPTSLAPSCTDISPSSLALPWNSKPWADPDSFWVMFCTTALLWERNSFLLLPGVSLLSL